MTDWEKLKVTELREVLKSRGIPLTGLKLKQQYIDKLKSLDDDGDDDGDNDNEKSRVVSDEEKPASDLPEKDPQPANGLPTTDHGDNTSQNGEAVSNKEPSLNATPSAILAASESTPVTNSGTETADVEVSETAEKTENGTLEQSFDDMSGEARVEKLPEQLPIELKKEESSARDSATPPPAEADTKLEEEAIKQNDPFILQEQPVEESLNGNTTDRGQTQDDALNRANVEGQGREEPIASKNTGDEDAVMTDGEQSAYPGTISESPDGQKKRKRGGSSPAPDSEDNVHKKKRANTGSPASRQGHSDSLNKIQQATDAAQATRNLSSFGYNNVNSNRAHPIEKPSRDVMDEPREENRAMLPSWTKQGGRETDLASRMSSNRDVSPAIHPATSSIYIRNFKRPLHIPSLRSHISSLAGKPEEDSIRVFFMDSIRTHALVTLTSVQAASRVRNSMHKTRFPDEALREPLWVDFVPDENVQGWIDEESEGSGGFGGRQGASKKYEIIYKDGGAGVKAILQEASGSHTQPQRPAQSHSHSDRAGRDDPAPIVPSGIHPSRARLVSQPPSRTHSHHMPQLSAQPVNSGKGFRALDELFSSTTTKPKLYYKLPTRSAIDNRLALIEDLRIGHDQMGRSGDEGMKRYTFEKSDANQQEHWVDKGPEFGFGRRGQERLVGFSTNYGTHRGRGNFRGGRPRGDSWRGR